MQRLKIKKIVLNENKIRLSLVWEKALFMKIHI